MKVLNTEEEIHKLIDSSEMTVIYFTGMDCGACEAIKFKVEEILKKFPKIKSGEINGENHPHICAKFEIFSVPIFLLFVDKKESLRIGRNVDLLDLEFKIQRYYEMIYID
ncbi:thioredoxin family protein [uncultured Clostridium sp.]|uniref:thioredoxin family protein n=1 Tax=uncultured Clostridium sp. TaxID=59620 RepID=UPI0025F60458|nr:thioredoxin family protein [uncultured Clostridium sp.]